MQTPGRENMTWQNNQNGLKKKKKKDIRGRFKTHREKRGEVKGEVSYEKKKKKKESNIGMQTLAKENVRQGINGREKLKEERTSSHEAETEENMAKLQNLE